MTFRPRTASAIAAATAALTLALGTFGPAAPRAQATPTASAPQRVPVPHHAYYQDWYWWHATWMSRCASRPDAQGRLGRARQWDSWCSSFVRFRANTPDALWRQGRADDSGRAGGGLPVNDH